MEEGVMRKGPPVIRGGLLFLFLLGSLTLVVWRQSRALEMQRSLELVRQERMVEESRRTALLRRVEQLESRTRVSQAAGSRLGMRLPSGEELVILPLADPTSSRLVGDAHRSGAVALARGEGG
jgi:cell division protein FtsL